MAISIGSDYMYTQKLNSTSSKTSADKLSSTISGLSENSTDEELMAACKSFEEYLVEQVVKTTKKRKTITSACSVTSSMPNMQS